MIKVVIEKRDDNNYNKATLNSKYWLKHMWK